MPGKTEHADNCEWAERYEGPHQLIAMPTRTVSVTIKALACYERRLQSLIRGMAGDRVPIPSQINRWSSELDETEKLRRCLEIEEQKATMEVQDDACS